MFGVSETPYDLRFQALGIPVRVHPFFWLVMGMIGWFPQNMPVVLIFIASAFASILVHEYGHGLTARAYGAQPSILLWGLGGLCRYQPDRQTPGQRLTVLLWGPGAGFVLCLVVMVVFSAAFGLTPAEHFAFVQAILPWMEPDPLHYGSALDKLDLVADPHALNARFWFYRDFLRINLFWGLLNLLPIWPLDGGQVTETVLSQVNPYNGRRWTHIISFAISALIAVVVYSQTQSFFNCLFFIYFAVTNYQMLDMIHRAQTMGIYDEDWWRR